MHYTLIKRSDSLRGKGLSHNNATCNLTKIIILECLQLISFTFTVMDYLPTIKTKHTIVHAGIMRHTNHRIISTIKFM